MLDGSYNPDFIAHSRSKTDQRQIKDFTYLSAVHYSCAWLKKFINLLFRRKELLSFWNVQVVLMHLQGLNEEENLIKSILKSNGYYFSKVETYIEFLNIRMYIFENNLTAWIPKNCPVDE